MGIPNNSRQVASNAIAALGNWISLHTGAGGGTTGANEATSAGGRRQTGWTPGTTGTNTGSVTNIPCAANTYTEGGVWSQQGPGGTFVGSGPFSSNVIVSGTGASIDVTPSITI